MAAMRWTDERKPVWLSNGCDLPALAWWQLHGAEAGVRGITQVWVLQHDVGESRGIAT